MSLYKSRVIKSANIKMKDQECREAPGFRKTSIQDSGDTGLPSREGEAEIERLHLAYGEEISQREAKAYGEGLQAGISQCEERQRGETKRRAESLESVIREVAMMKARIIDEAEEDIIGLALHVAEKIVHLEIGANREVIHHLLQEAMKSVLDREDMMIRLHPDDYLYIMEIKNDFLQGFDGLKNVNFQKDETIRRGGALIETRHGEVDARIDQQFREVKQAMQSIRKQRDTQIP